MPSKTDDVASDHGRIGLSTRGRRRDDSRTQAIVDAAGALLLEVGFDQLRIQDVADRAGCGTGAIYRRWETKEALMAEAIMNLAEPEPEVTDDPEADLRALLTQKFAAFVATPDLLPGAVGAVRSDERIAEAMRARSDDGVYRRAIARLLGDTHPQLEILASVPPGIALHRIAFQGGLGDIDALVDQVISLVRSAQQASTN